MLKMKDDPLSVLKSSISSDFLRCCELPKYQNDHKSDIVSVHCREEGCIGSYNVHPQRRDFPWAVIQLSYLPKQWPRQKGSVCPASSNKRILATLGFKQKTHLCMGTPRIPNNCTRSDLCIIIARLHNNCTRSHLCKGVPRIPNNCTRSGNLQ